MAMSMEHSVNRKRRVRPDMNVTPLVDVVLVLLIIFMVLAPVLTKSFSVHVPPKDETDEKLDQSNDPNRPLVLAIDADGKVMVNGVELADEEVTPRLHRMFNARPDNALYVDANDEIPYGSVIHVLDLSRDAGAHPVVMLTKPLR